ncbi:MAG: HEAT repeat domain-containing protein [Armatimonadetes bacterium]|nr:HEAT repeat domain-containing protein [Armatimonadota bacterium]MCX7967236.1 HEAT repeat domain-containing protein [Armatimonadota bacterium]MDW8143330.1 HEAT repeat domain-containing protein [Armatimonadota bacterium]
MDIIARLIEQLASEDEVVRVQAGELLIQMGSAAVRPLIDALQNPRYPARPLIASTLGQIGDKRAVEPLISALKDPDKLVRYHSALALGKLKDQRAVKPLIHALFDEMPPIGPDPLTGDLMTVRSAAAQALGELRAGEAIPALKVLLTDSNKGVRKSVVQALGQIGTEEAIRVLCDGIWRERDEALLELMIRFIARFPSAQTLETLKQIAQNHPEERVRQLARNYLEEAESHPKPQISFPQKQPTTSRHSLWLLGGAVLAILVAGLFRLGWKQNRYAATAIAGSFVAIAFGVWKHYRKSRSNQPLPPEPQLQTSVPSHKETV